MRQPNELKWQIKKKNWGGQTGVKQKSGGVMAHPDPLEIATGRETARDLNAF